MLLIAHLSSILLGKKLKKLISEASIIYLLYELLAYSNNGRKLC